MKKIFYTALLVIVAGAAAGCQVRTGQQAGEPKDAGVFKSQTKGEAWQQAVLIPTVTGRPNSLATIGVSALVMDPGDRKALYLGSGGNGLFYTYDAAATWQPVTSLGAIAITDIAVDPEDKCNLYVASGNKLIKSADCGRSWTQVYFDSDLKMSLTGVAVDQADTRRVFITTSRGELILSQDEGRSWATVQRFENAVKKIVVSPHDSRIIFIATQSKGLFRSRDGGRNFDNLKDQLKEFKDAKNFKDMAMCAAEDGFVLMATGYGLLRSEDNGDSWQEIELIPPAQKASINAIAVSPKEPKEIYYVTATTFYRTVDGGANWITKKLPTTKAGVRLVVDPEQPGIIYLGVRGPVKK